MAELKYRLCSLVTIKGVCAERLPTFDCVALQCPTRPSTADTQQLRRYADVKICRQATYSQLAEVVHLCLQPPAHRVMPQQVGPTSSIATQGQVALLLSTSWARGPYMLWRFNTAPPSPGQRALFALPRRLAYAQEIGSAYFGDMATSNSSLLLIELRPESLTAIVKE